MHRVVERRNTIPILSNVLLRASGANLDMKARPTLRPRSHGSNARHGGAGWRHNVPAHLLYEIVRKLPDGSEVLLATNPDGSSMTVRQDARSSRFSACRRRISQTDRWHFTHSFKLKATDLKMLIDRTQFAISTEETRYYLNGIFFHTIESGGDLKLRAVATDGHRLARADVDAPSGSEGMPASSFRARLWSSCKSSSTILSLKSQSKCPTQDPPDHRAISS